MKKSLINGLAASALVLSALTANAADELVIYVFKDGEAAADLTVRVDGQDEKTLSNSGSALFDLSAGAHSVQLIQNGETIHSFRFNNALGQLTDINVALSATANPKVAVESFFKTETASDKSKAPKGFVQGQVKAQGSPVADASISVDGEDISVTTDASGNYQIELPRGVYSLTVSHPDMKLVELEDVRVVSNVTKGFNLRMSPKSAVAAPSLDLAAPQIEEVTVLAKYNPGAFEESERFSANVIDTLGIEDLARFGGGDVAASVVRLPSVTVQDGGFIFVRGLGGRYVTSTLNGATLPSPNPVRRTIPLDLFPSNIVSQLDVKKTFLANQPGESTGGNLVINTRTFPDEGAGKLSVKLGYVNGLTGETVFTDSSEGDYDFLGFDDGTRREPAAAEAIARILDPLRTLGVGDSQGNIPPQLETSISDDVEVQLSRAAALLLTDNLELKEQTATPDVSIGANFGDLFYVGDSEVGYFAAINYKSGWAQKTDGETFTYQNGFVSSSFDFEESTYKVDVSALLSFGLNIGSSSYESNTLLSRVTTTRTRVADGFITENSSDIYRYSIDYSERQFISQQFTGEHFLDSAGNLSTDWQVSLSQATRYAPDRREVQFNRGQGLDDFSLTLSETERRYDDLADVNFDVSNNYSWIISSDGEIDQTLTVGWQYIYRERDAESSSYGFEFNASDRSVLVSSDLNVSEIITPENITGDNQTGLEFSVLTLPSDSYESDLQLPSVFLSYDLLLDSTFQFIFGARYEEYEQSTDTFRLQPLGAPTSSEITENTLLPSLGFNWLYSEEQQIRFAITKTAARPDFKEAANAIFFDPEFDFTVFGNPDLDVSEVTNFDVRWEYYWSDTGNVSVAAFYKDFKKPIERVIQDASGTASNSRSFVNADSGELLGFEIDGRIDFPLNESFTQNIFIAGNVSVIDSEVVFRSSNGSERTSDLQGAPEYTFNLIVGWDDLENNQELTVLFNQNGKSKVDDGLGPNGDIVEEPLPDLNINYKKTFGNDFVFSAKLKNILDADVEFTQDGNTFQSYRKGTSLEAGIDWEF